MGGTRWGRGLRGTGGILLLAFVLRVATVVVAQVLSPPLGPGGRRAPVLLDDEAGYYGAARWIIEHAPWTPMNPVLDHLSGNAYLGLVTTGQLLFGPYPLAPRLVNAILGTLVVWLVISLATRHFGVGRGRLAGLAAALWPPFIAWGAFMLRDTLVTFLVIAVWWSLHRWGRGERVRATAVGTGALVLLLGLREYLFALVLAAVATTTVGSRLLESFPGRGRGVLVAAGGAVAIVGTLVLLGNPGAWQALAYRQAVAKLEARGNLYVPPGLPVRGEFAPGDLVLVVGASPLRAAGVVRGYGSGDLLIVGLADGSVQELNLTAVRRLSEATLGPDYVAANAVATLGEVLVGATGYPRRTTDLAWIADALTWDLLLLAGIYGATRLRPPRAALFPFVVVLGTVVSLVVVPGAPANVARHRTAQTAALLLVLAAGVPRPLGRHRSTRPPNVGAASAPSTPSSASGPVASFTRSTT